MPAWLNLQSVGISVLVLIVLLGAAYGKGRMDEHDHCVLLMDQLRAEVLEQALRDQRAAVNAAISLERTQAHAEIRYRTRVEKVDRIVEKPVYLAVCFDNDGLRLANEALTGEADPAGESIGPLPESGTPVRWASRYGTQSLN